MADSDDDISMEDVEMEDVSQDESAGGDQSLADPARTAALAGGRETVLKEIVPTASPAQAVASNTAVDQLPVGNCAAVLSNNAQRLTAEPDKPRLMSNLLGRRPAAAQQVVPQPDGRETSTGSRAVAVFAEQKEQLKPEVQSRESNDWISASAAVGEKEKYQQNGWEGLANRSTLQSNSASTVYASSSDDRTKHLPRIIVGDTVLIVKQGCLSRGKRAVVRQIFNASKIEVTVDATGDLLLYKQDELRVDERNPLEVDRALRQMAAANSQVENAGANMFARQDPRKMHNSRPSPSAPRSSAKLPKAKSKAGAKAQGQTKRAQMKRECKSDKGKKIKLDVRPGQCV